LETVKNGDFGLRRNANHCGLWLNADTNAKKRGELAGLLGHGDNGRAIGNAENVAWLAVQMDDIASAETEWKEGFHLEF
jgi:hypothetical protein